MFRKLLLSLALLVCLPLVSTPALAVCGSGVGTCFVVPAGGAWVSGTFSSTTGGVSCACTPATGDALILDSAAGNLTSVVGNPSLASLDASGTGGSGSPYTRTFTHTGGQTITISGNLFKLVAGMTYTPANTTSIVTFTSTAGTTLITTGTKQLAAVTFNGAGGTFQLQDDMTLSNAASSPVTLTAGTFDANNHNISTGTYTSTGASTRAMLMGSGTWTITGTSGGIWSLGSTSSGLSVTAGTSTVQVTSTAGPNLRSIDLGSSLSFNNFTIAAASSGGAVSISGTTPTITSLTISGPISITDSIVNLTATTFTLSGASASALIMFRGSAPGTGGPVTITSTTPSGTWVAINNITFATGAFSGTSCFDTKGNNFNGGSCTVPAGGGGGQIIGGWLLERDLNPSNDNTAAFIAKVA